MVLVGLAMIRRQSESAATRGERAQRLLAYPSSALALQPSSSLVRPAPIDSLPLPLDVSWHVRPQRAFLEHATPQDRPQAAVRRAQPPLTSRSLEVEQREEASK